ncbi:hypothetical protein Taro_000256 [Colocasia esculenta]|uniref:Uncharacterized protein n=1 Tax=Colocasia esculenta TaxID=4460 RepID=A0A843TCE3_COLES|nr:hypothetical protein [Colocasia esculenta]
MFLCVSTDMCVISLARLRLVRGRRSRIELVIRLTEFWPKARLASISIDVDVVSASTPWTPTLSPVSSDVDAKFSDLHALQTRNPGSKLPQPLGSCPQRFERGITSPPAWLCNPKSEVLKLDPATCCIKELAGSSRKASSTSDCTGACSRTRRKAILEAAMASRGRRGGAPAREDEPRRDERAEQQAPAPQGPVLPPPPLVDYGVFMQGLVQAMQTQAHTQAALQAQLEAQIHHDRL